MDMVHGSLLKNILLFSLPLMAVNLLQIAFNAASVNIVVARKIGRGLEDSIYKTIHTSYFLALAGGILLTVFGFFFSPVLLRWMKTSSDIIQLSIAYTRIYFAGSLPLMFVFCHYAYKRTNI